MWGVRYMDDLVLRDRDVAAGGDLGVTGSGLDERFYAMQDPNWNVLAIANVSGTVQERYRYTAYGTPTFLTGAFGSRANTSYAWDALYTGRQLDAETGLYQYRNRFYHAELGRFVNRDPVESDVNQYRYVLDNPLLFTDPDGLKCAFCDDADRIKQLENTPIKGIKGRTCHVKIKCQEKCQHGGGDTSLPTPVSGSPGQYDIDVCVSSQWDAPSQDAIIAHEMVHVQQFCNTGGGIHPKLCAIMEREAYKTSCTLAFPGNPKKQQKCIQCGVSFACGTKPPPGGCTNADIGLNK